MDKERKKLLVKQRGLCKASLTRMQTFIDNYNPSEHELLQARSRFEDLQNIWDKYSEYQDALEIEDDDEDHAQDREDFEVKFYDVKAKYAAILNGCQTSSEHSANTSSHNASQAHIKLPVISLPKFSGNFDEWVHFRDTFEALIVHNNQLSDVQRHHYLLSALSGEAHMLIKNLAVSNDNFYVAWDLVKHRYNNTKLIAKTHVKQLLSLPTVNKCGFQPLRTLINHVQSNLNALQALNIEVPLHELLLSQEILNAVDPETRKEYELSCVSPNFPPLEELFQFLETKCKALEVIQGPHDKSTNKSSNQTSERSDRSRAHHSYVTVSSNHCSCCKETHPLFKCPSFLAMNVKQRFHHVKQGNLCFNCLREYTKNHECSNSKCKVCYKKHHTLLHITQEENQGDRHNNPNISNNVKSTSHSITSRDESVAKQSYCTYKNKETTEIMLATALVMVPNKYGQLVHCRALLDSASQSHFITEQLVQQLKLPRRKHHAAFQGISDTNSQAHHMVSITLKSRVSDWHTTIECSVLPRITGTIPSTYINCEDWNMPENLELADYNFNHPGHIDLLLGADVFFEVLRHGKHVRPHHPVLQETALGWIVSGKTPIAETGAPKHTFFIQTEDTLEYQLKRFWELEAIDQPILSPEERNCENHFIENTDRLPNGRFQVRLPKRDDPRSLGDSYGTALQRLLQMERRFSKNPQLKTKYENFMQEYEDLDHMELIDADDSRQKTVFYLPHHAVFKDSTTTSLRVVFDGGAKTSTGIALNDILSAGPTIQQDLCSIILRFRTHEVALKADIAKMYRQIVVHPEDQDLQRILWRRSTEDPVRSYRLKTVTYGTTSAPFLAVRCLKMLADENELNHPDISNILKNDFYVDDLLSGCSSSEEASRIQQELTSLLAQGGFPLRKWSSNCQEFLSKIPSCLLETQESLDLDEHFSVTTLGLLWHPSTDQLQVKIANTASNEGHTLTKRRVLSSTASTFDPLGLLSPTVVTFKIFLQQLWQHQLGWDEPLPPSLRNHWIKLTNSLHTLSNIKINRKVLCSNATNLQLHGFCDSSERAYGACIYLRSRDREGKIVCALVCSKTRVAPVKRTTLPRLELCGAVLLATLLKKTVLALKLNINQVFLWTDSTLVLTWIAGPSTKWKTFVGNRVAIIQENTTIADWRHVPSSSNPADLISRGISAEELENCSLWWKGPSWLEGEPSTWPNLEVKIPQTVPERRIVTFLTTKLNDDWMMKYSTLSRLLRVTAYIRRFINNCRTQKHSRNSSPLTAREIHDALINCIKIAQHSCYHQDIRALRKHEPLRDSQLKSLLPFIDGDGLIRVGGRLEHADLPYDAIHQLILPQKHHLTKLIVVDEHFKLLHAGLQLLISSLRQRYWIPSIKRLARSTIFQCVKCYRFKARASEQLMGSVPSSRLQPSRPFRTIGVDYAGPITLRVGGPRSKTTSKGYIAVFVCFVFKAVHLEVVTSLTTEAFLAALKRFIARRGKPSEIHSDNGTNFQGAANQLHELYRLLQSKDHNEKIQEMLSRDGCNWSFIPPHAPHFGGLWEASVKSMKHHLRRVLGNQVANYEELCTLVTQIEACMNSRPLYAIPDDPHFRYLSPGHFLIGEPLTQLPSVDVTNKNVSLLNRWKEQQRRLQHFWRQWSSDYLQELQQRRRWDCHHKDLQVGNVVLLREDNIPPLQWPMGVIQELHPGRDGHVRVVTVRTSSGSLKRPITKLSVLPIESGEPAVKTSPMTQPCVNTSSHV